MPAPKGNQYWQKRKKHGREKAIKSPQQLWELACDYFQYCEDNPWHKIDYKGKDVEMVTIPTRTPFTWEGLYDFLFSKGILVNLKDYKSNKDGRYKDFATIITRIGDVIKSQQLEGAMVGAYNSNLVSRYNGISDKKEVEQKGTITIKHRDIETNPEDEKSDRIE